MPTREWHSTSASLTCREHSQTLALLFYPDADIVPGEYNAPEPRAGQPVRRARRTRWTRIR
jgi:hypothetical protein